MKKRQNGEKMENKRVISTRTITVAAVFLLCAAAAILHSALLHADFLLYDDQSVVTQNPLLAAGSLKEVFTSFSAGLYHPLTSLSWIVEKELFGFNPLVFHLTNLALHLISIALVALFGALLWPRRRGAAIMLAALFAFHPMHVESVAWISERKDVLCQVFYLLALCLHLGGGQNRRGGKIRYLAVLACFLCAALAKPMAVTLPLVLVLLDYTRDYPRWQGRMLWSKWPHFAIAAGIGIITVMGQVDARQGSLAAGSLGASLGSATHFLTLCLSKAVWPVSLSVIYEAPGALPDWADNARAVFLIAIFAIAFVRVLPWRRDGMFGLAFFGITILPVVRVIQFGDASLFNDRFFYLPGIGLGFALIALALECQKRFWPSLYGRYFLVGSGAVIVVLLAGATAERCSVWQNDETLLEDVLRHYPGSAMAHTFLAQYQASGGRHREAAEHFRMALTLAPPTALRQAGLAYSLFYDGKGEEALAATQVGLKTWPSSGEMLYTSGIIALGRNQTAAARVAFLQALSAPIGLAGPYNAAQKARIHVSLAAVDLREEKWSDALADCARALAENPLNAEAYYNQGLVLRIQHQYAGAAAAMARALALNPQLTEALADLAIVHYEMGERQLALDEAARSVALAPTVTRYRCNFGSLLHAAGLLTQAKEQFEEALRGEPASACARAGLAGEAGGG